MQPTDIARDLVREFTSAGLTSDSIAAHLGPDAMEALFRGEPGAVLEACDDSRLSGLIRFFLVREKMTAEELSEHLPARLVLSLIDAAVVSPTPSGDLQIALDIRPHIIAGRDRLIFSDLDASMTCLLYTSDAADE